MEQEKKQRGRKAGDTKEYTIIKDDSMKPYIIAMDESNYILQKVSNDGTTINYGYFSSLISAITKIVKLNMANKGKTLSLREYLDEYKKEVEKLNKLLK